MKWALVLSLAFGRPQEHHGGDRWTGLDKWEHFAASAVVQSVAYGMARSGQGHSASLRVGGAAVVVVGVAKETFDWRTKGEFSLKDLTWDGFGGVAAALALHAVR